MSERRRSSTASTRISPRLPPKRSLVCRFAGGPPPAVKPKYGRAHARFERGSWYRHVASWALGCSLLAGGMWLADWDMERAEALVTVARVWTIAMLADGVYSLSFTFKPRPEPRRRQLSYSAR